MKKGIQSADDITSAGAQAPARISTRTGPKWEEAARERLRNAIKRFGKPLADLVARDANEGDTRLWITDFLCEALGYDKYTDLTTEYAVKGEFADYGIRIDKQLVAFIEVKRVTTKLGIKHLRQAQMYAVNEGIEWIILTNGAEWQVYHLEAGLPVVTELAFRVDLLGSDPPAQKAKHLFYLTRDAFKRKQIEELWRARRATSPASLGKVLRSENVVNAIRKELWRETGHRIDEGEVRKLLEDTILKPECLEK
jgi:predicted type IV restriction endonuclease